MTTPPIFPPTREGLPLGLGGAPLGNMFAPVPEAQVSVLFETALADGCRSFDTAPHYGHGLSELRFGQMLRGQAPGDFALSSKVGRLLTPDSKAPRDQNGFVDGLPFNQHWDFSAQGVRRSVEDSLQRLGLAALDTVFVHDCDLANHGERYPQVLQQVLHEALPELHALRRQGLLRHIGLGVNDVQVCLDVLQGMRADAGIDCLLLAGRYSLIDHSGLAALLPLCQSLGVRIALGGVFNSGILATGVRGGAELRFNYEPAAQHWVARVAAVEAICDTYGVPLRAAALQFPLAHPTIEVVMLGARQASEWQDAVAMMRHAIPAGFWKALRDGGLLPADAPTPRGA
jgi:D-threo-aldose 1-dehydrogenase